MHSGEWYMCQSCGEESIFYGRDPQDFCCSVCGCGAVILDSDYGRQPDFVSRMYA
jgi:hypothetical protein